jgi:hypothetical protein
LHAGDRRFESGRVHQAYVFWLERAAIDPSLPFSIHLQGGVIMASSTSRSALFAGLVQDEAGNPVDVVMVGAVPNYVIDDAGFRRHVESETVDRQVIELLRAQFMEHKEIATDAMLQMLGQDDLFTKAMIDASIKNMDQVIGQGLPDGAGAWLGMLGFRVIVDSHGQVVRLDMPEQYEEFDE